MQYLSWYGKGKELAQKEIDYSNQHINLIIDDYIHSERDRQILKRRYIDGIKFEPLAEEFDLSVRQVKNIIYKHEKSIFKHLERG